MWRPGYECELAIVSNSEFSANSGSLDSASPAEAMSPNTGVVPLPSTSLATVARIPGFQTPPKAKDDIGDQIEIWDVRRGYIAKWAVRGSGVDGGVTGMVIILCGLEDITCNLIFPRGRHDLWGLAYALVPALFGIFLSV